LKKFGGNVQKRAGLLAQGIVKALCEEGKKKTAHIWGGKVFWVA